MSFYFLLWFQWNSFTAFIRGCLSSTALYNRTNLLLCMKSFLRSFNTYQHFATIICCPSLLNIIKEPEFVKFHQKDFFCWNIKSVPEKSLLKHLVGAWEEKIPVVNQRLSKSVNDILIREIAKCKSFFNRVLNQGGRKEHLDRVLLIRFSSIKN